MTALPARRAGQRGHSGLHRREWVRPALPGAILDAIFFLIGMLGTITLAYSFTVTVLPYFPWNLIAVIVVWALVAYITLPRLHRALTTIYVPGYFLGRTRTADGLFGDPINLAFDGTARQIHQAMTAAGWTLADDITPRSAWGIVVSSVLRRSYPQAPVSSLFLFGRKQDLAYQQEVDGSATKRHHLRVWRCPDGWPLPGGGTHVRWLGAGTYDTRVGLSLFTLQVTHRIAADIDVERDYIVDSLEKADQGVDVGVIEDFSTSYHSRNGGGDLVRTDGALPIIDLSSITVDRSVPEAPQVVRAGRGHHDPFEDGGVASSDPDSPVSRNDIQEHPRPLAVAVSLIFVGLALIGESISAVFELHAELLLDREGPTEFAVAVVGGFIFMVEVWIGFAAVRTFRGYARARTLLMTLCALSIPGGLIRGGGFLVDLSYVGISACYIFALIALSSPASRRWVRARTWIRKGHLAAWQARQIEASGAGGEGRAG